MAQIIKGPFSKPVSDKTYSSQLYDDLLDTAYGLDGGIKGYSGGATGKKSAKAAGYSCYLSHPPLPLPGGKVIYGGSCTSPAVKDADIYVALDHSWYPSPEAWPWQKKREEVFFKISDMSVPKSATDFKNLVNWLEDQIKAGKKVHVGCLGGHGRTGMVLAALYFTMSSDKGAIQYVRKNYCKKVVETPEQVAWLVKHFGMDTANPSKTWGSYSSSSSKKASSAKGSTLWDDDGKLKGGSTGTRSRYFTPVSSKTCIWGQGVIPRK